MRTFVAVDLPENLKAELRIRQETLKRAAQGGRWVRPEGIHLTLKFLGEISEEQSGQVTESLSQVPRFEAFSVEVKGFGFFPNSRRPRVLWVGVEGGEPLAALAAEVEKSLQAVGFPPEARPFKPHLTLARFRFPRPQPGLAKELSATHSPSLGHLTVSQFSLIESRLNPQGAEYRKIADYPPDAFS